MNRLSQFRDGACIYFCTICKIPRQYGHGVPEDKEAIVQLICEGNCETADPIPHRYLSSRPFDEVEKNEEAAIQATS